LMARISDKVKGSGFWAQLTGQFAVEEMISVTRACRSTGVGRAMVFPSLIVDLLRIYKSHRPQKFSGFDGYEGVARGATRPIEQLLVTFAVAVSRKVGSAETIFADSLVCG